MAATGRVDTGAAGAGAETGAEGAGEGAMGRGRCTCAAGTGASEGAGFTEGRVFGRAKAPGRLDEGDAAGVETGAEATLDDSSGASKGAPCSSTR